jgi:hypothetical protein
MESKNWTLVGKRFDAGRGRKTISEGDVLLAIEIDVPYKELPRIRGYAGFLQEVCIEPILRSIPNRLKWLKLREVVRYEKYGDEFGSEPSDRQRLLLKRIYGVYSNFDEQVKVSNELFGGYSRWV